MALMCPAQSAFGQAVARRRHRPQGGGVARVGLLMGLVIAGLGCSGCRPPPTREKLLSCEVRALHCYCASNAVVAEAALLDCARYAEQCRQAGVGGIAYDEILALTYGRLYVVARGRGRDEAAERYLIQYARFHARLSTEARRSAGVYGDMERVISHKFDGGLRTAWRRP